MIRSMKGKWKIQIEEFGIKNTKNTWLALIQEFPVYLFGCTEYGPATCQHFWIIRQFSILCVGLKILASRFSKSKQENFDHRPEG